MSPRDDDQGVRTSRDEAVIAGRAVTSDDAALAEVLGSLRASAHVQAPRPSEALRALLASGLDPADAAPTPDAPTAVLDLDAARSRRRRRALSYVAGAGVAATLALGGSAAAAAVRDGVQLGEVPGVIGRQISGTVGDALEAIGLRPTSDPVPTPDPLRENSRTEAPDPVDGEPGRSGEEPGRSGDAPASPHATTGPTEAPGRSDEAPGRSDQVPDPASTPGSEQPGGDGDTSIHDGGTPGGSGGGNDGSDGAANGAEVASPGVAAHP